jgi:hypothetical protein
MKRFMFKRTEDVSGVSGTGYVAEGIEFGDGSVAIRWVGDHPSTAVWDSIEDAIQIHGHGGKTTVEWLDVTVRGA